MRMEELTALEVLEEGEEVVSTDDRVSNFMRYTCEVCAGSLVRELRVSVSVVLSCEQIPLCLCGLYVCACDYVCIDSVYVCV